MEDSPDRMLFWLPAGTVRKVPFTPRSREGPGNRTARIIDLLEQGDWVHVDHVWDISCLWILRPGDWHAVWISFRPSGEQFGWYVNLQRPFRRTALGIESMDLQLDVVATPDRVWSWKDDDEFQQVVDRGLLDEATVERVRAEATRVISRLEANETPFGDGWERWRPDPTWETPQLPPGWDDASI